MRHALPLLLLLATAAGAQPAVIAGTVRDADGAPLPGANVYLSGTARGAASGADGRFEIAGVPPGAYRLVGSMLGFAPDAHDLRLGPGERRAVDLTLAPVALDLGGVAVEAARDDRWRRHLERFTTTLLGESANADSTRILNPEVLAFHSRWGTLTATASAPLVIENRALGYRLTYDLTEFSASDIRVSYDGDERFEPLTPTDRAEADRWAEARARAYRGSLSHLLQALLSRTAEDEAFSGTHLMTDPNGVRIPFRVSLDGFLERDADGWGTLRFRGQLDVVYAGESEASEYLTSEWFREHRRRPDTIQRSGLLLDGLTARIDPQGTPEDPDAIMVMGYMAFERLADRVPEEYRPPPDL